MWGLFSKDPSKDFPYELGERLGHIHLANKTVWTLHAGKHRATGEQVRSRARNEPSRRPRNNQIAHYEL